MPLPVRVALSSISNAGSTGYGNMPGLEGITNLGKNLLDGNLKFKYDQGTYDQAYNNLIGSAQRAFDSYSNRTKTNNLFQNLPGLKMGAQLLGGANSKVGQQSSLLDAMTNQQIMDFGAQQAQWAAGQANNAAMTAGQGNQQTALGQYGYDSSGAVCIERRDAGGYSTLCGKPQRGGQHVWHRLQHDEQRWYVTG